MIGAFRNRKVQRVFIQAGFVALLLLAVVSAFVTARSSLEQQGITSGFDFLERSTGFDVGFSLIGFSPNDTYEKMLWVGLLNTLFLGAIGIVLANLIGLAVAVLRTSRNATLRLIGTIYVDTFRNIPILLQVLFWYAVYTHLPRPKQAYALLDSVFVSARGVFFPGLNVGGGWAAVCVFAVLAGLLAALWISQSRRFSRMPDEARRAWVRGIALLGLATGLVSLVVGRIPDTDLVSVPALKGLNFRGGIRVSPELSALATAIAVYGGAYLAEVFRAGFLSVGKGQAEAAQSLGLKPLHVFSRVRLPLAIRAILPTLINQYVWLFKATTLGIAVGFTDFFMVTSVSITQSGQTIELIAILMVGFLVMNNSMSFVLNRVNKAIALKGG